MADFCKQCSIENFGEDFHDLAHLMPKDKYKPDEGIGASALCEGCGWCVVNYEGECIAYHCLEEHGKQ